jgi:hypothetical protein
MSGSDSQASPCAPKRETPAFSASRHASSRLHLRSVINLGLNVPVSGKVPSAGQCRITGHERSRPVTEISTFTKDRTNADSSNAAWKDLFSLLLARIRRASGKARG